MNKELNRFNELYGKALEQYREGNLKQCYDTLVKLNTETHLHKEFLILERAQVLAGLERFDDAYELLEEFVIEKNLWFDNNVIKFKEFDQIRGNERFKKLIELSERNKFQKYEGTHKRYHFINDYKPGYRVIFLLHGNWFFGQAKHMEDNITTLEKEVDKLEKITLCLIYSSKIGVLGYPYWYDYIEGAREASQVFNNLCDKFSIPKEDVILTGFSAGGGVLFESAMNHCTDIQNIALTMPHLPMLKEYESRMDKLTNKYNFFIHTGDKDHLHVHALELEKLLVTKYIQHKIFIEEGRGHNIDKDMYLLLQKFVEYYAIKKDTN